MSLLVLLFTLFGVLQGSRLPSNGVLKERGFEAARVEKEVSRHFTGTADAQLNDDSWKPRAADSSVDSWHNPFRSWWPWWTSKYTGYFSSMTVDTTPIGITLAILAAALGTTAKQLIAYSAYTKSKRTASLGLGLNMVVNPVVDSSAYAFASQVVVAPFASLDVIFNILTAPYTLKFQNEKITLYHIAGTILIASGAVCTSFFGSVTDGVLNVYELEAQFARPASRIFILVEVSVIILLAFCLESRQLAVKLRGVATGCLAGMLVGNIFFLKGFLGILRTCVINNNWEAFLRPTPYICLATAAVAALSGNLIILTGLKEFKGVFLITIFQGAHMATACLSGTIVMSELAGASAWRIMSYWFSVCLIIMGIAVTNCAAAHASQAIDDVDFSKSPSKAGSSAETEVPSESLSCSASDISEPRSSP